MLHKIQYLAKKYSSHQPHELSVNLTSRNERLSLLSDALAPIREAGGGEKTRDVMDRAGKIE